MLFEEAGKVLQLWRGRCQRMSGRWSIRPHGRWRRCAVFSCSSRSWWSASCTGSAKYVLHLHLSHTQDCDVKIKLVEKTLSPQNLHKSVNHGFVLPLAKGSNYRIEVCNFACCSHQVLKVLNCWEVCRNFSAIKMLWGQKLYSCVLSCCAQEDLKS